MSCTEGHVWALRCTHCGELQVDEPADKDAQSLLFSFMPQEDADISSERATAKQCIPHALNALMDVYIHSDTPLARELHGLLERLADSKDPMWKDKAIPFSVGFAARNMIAQVLRTKRKLLLNADKQKEAAT